MVSYLLFFRSKSLVQDFYLAPYACAEVGFLHLEEGDLDQAKEFLNRARYKRESSPLYVMVLKEFCQKICALNIIPESELVCQLRLVSIIPCSRYT